MVASDIPVFREVARDAALFYGDPRNDTLLLVALKRILSDINLRNELLLKSKKVLELYSEGSFIKKHLELYKKVLKNKKCALDVVL